MDHALISGEQPDSFSRLVGEHGVNSKLSILYIAESIRVIGESCSSPFRLR